MLGRSGEKVMRWGISYAPDMHRHLPVDTDGTLSIIPFSKRSSDEPEQCMRCSRSFLLWDDDRGGKALRL